MGGGPEKFVWPPRRDGPPQVVDPGAGEGGRARAARGATWLEVFEREWVGVRGWSWGVRARQAGWVVDGRGAYCPRCGETAGEFEADADGCRACRGKRLPWERAVRLGSYEGELRDAVMEFKFGPWRKVGSELGRLLGKRVREDLELMRWRGRVMVVPVPTTTGRRMARGIDHSMVLAREVARATGGRVKRLVWRRWGGAQRGASATERARNVAGAFRPRRFGRGMDGALVVVVDDVRTTGATLRGVCRAARAAAREGGAAVRIWTAVVGVTPRGIG